MHCCHAVVSTSFLVVLCMEQIKAVITPFEFLGKQSNNTSRTKNAPVSAKHTCKILHTCKWCT